MQHLLIKTTMKKRYTIICFVGLFLISACKKNAPLKTIITDPQLIAHIDSMLKAVGAGSYANLLTGKLEGNFSFSSHYFPYEANCSTPTAPFKINTQLSGGISLDTANRFTLINNGDLYVNNIKIIADNENRYIVAANTINSAALDKLYGTTSTIKIIKDGTTVLATEMYIPKNIVMKGIDCLTASFANNPLKSGFRINWNADNKNNNGIVIQLFVKDINTIERYSYLLVADNGYYIFNDNDLNQYPKEKNPLGIEVTLMRGNFSILKGVDNRKYNFNSMTTCSYLFKQ